MHVHGLRLPSPLHQCLDLAAEAQRVKWHHAHADLVTALLLPRRAGSVLIYGPMGAGATTVWHALQHRTLPHGTVTSMQPNETTCAPLLVRSSI